MSLHKLQVDHTEINTIVLLLLFSTYFPQLTVQRFNDTTLSTDSLQPFKLMHEHFLDSSTLQMKLQPVVQVIIFS